MKRVSAIQSVLLLNDARLALPVDSGRRRDSEVGIENCNLAAYDGADPQSSRMVMPSRQGWPSGSNGRDTVRAWHRYDVKAMIGGLSSGG